MRLSSAAARASVYAGSLAGMLSKAESVQAGRVVAVKPGFYNFRLPGSLVEISIEEVLRGKPKREAYFFLPSAAFELNGRSYCFTSEDQPLPRIGETVVIFADEHPPLARIIREGETRRPYAW
jgi:hypothetical protein